MIHYIDLMAQIEASKDRSEMSNPAVWVEFPDGESFEIDQVAFDPMAGVITIQIQE